MEEKLAIAVIPQKFLDEIKTELLEMKEILKDKRKEEFNSGWIESSEARKMLKVSQKTWQTYRDNRVIPFSQIGRKIYVKRADIEEFLESNYVPKAKKKSKRKPGKK